MPMRLLIASNNRHKIREIQEILGAYFPAMLSQQEAGLVLDVLEDGTTFEENAMKKAEETLAAAPAFQATLADDSGLMVDALQGAPGVYSARFAGSGHDDEANNEKLLSLMRDVPDAQRGCQFVSAIALARRNRPTLCVTGLCRGVLLRAHKGQGGFGYDPLFFYEPTQKSFAQMGAEEKNAISHRRRALEAMKALLEQEQ